MTPTQTQQWRQQWLVAEKGLRAQKFRDLSTMTEAQARAASDTLLRLIPVSAVAERRRLSSGLVAQQALFHHVRPKSPLPRGS